MHFDAERLEHQASGDLGAASFRAEIDRLAFQLMNVVHVGAHQDVHLLVEQLGDIGDLVDEIRAELAGLGDSA